MDTAVRAFAHAANPEQTSPTVLSFAGQAIPVRGTIFLVLMATSFRSRKRGIPFEKTRRAEIYYLMKDYAELHRSLPNTNAVYEYLVAGKLDISRSTFYVHFKKLIAEGWIEVDPNTKAVSIGPSELYILERGNP